MKITFLERAALTQILPKEGSFETLILVKDIQEKVSLKQEELEYHKTGEPDQNGNVLYKDLMKEYDIEMSKSEVSIVKDNLKQLSDEKKLTLDMLTLYEKFN